MQRIYVPWFVYCERYGITDKHVLHQFIKVLKSSVWDKIILFDGHTSTDYLYEITKIEKKEITLEFLDGVQKTEWKKDISLYQALPNKNHKIEYILQKWVEVGVSHFYFFRSERSQKLHISEHKEQRFHQIIIEATEQCWRNILPTLMFSENGFWDVPSQGTSIMLNPLDETAQRLKNLELDDDATVHIFIGPEWGFSDTEINTLQDSGCISLHLWSNILRTETAWVVTSFYLNQM